MVFFGDLNSDVRARLAMMMLYAKSVMGMRARILYVLDDADANGVSLSRVCRV